MSAAAILERCRAAGVSLHADGDRLKVTAPRPPPAELLDELRTHKAELLRLLAPVLPAAMLEDLAERAAIIGEHAETPEAWADVERDAVRLVQCRTCAHFTPDRLNPLAGIGRCIVDGPALSMSPHAVERGLCVWPNAPRYCTRWGAAA